jgi:CBS domain-containing protein
MTMSKVSQILARKGEQIWSVGPDTTVFEALGLMAEHNIGAVLVLEQNQVAGIFSERDYARKVVLENKSSQATPVSEIMTRDVISVSPDDDFDSCLQKMSTHRIRHLPVVDAKGLKGIISIGDVVNFLITEQKFKIDQLENYIQGS